MILRYFFAHDYSLTQAAFGGGITFALMTERYVTAFVLFAVCIAISVVGEIALEKQDCPL